jgi:hypothetical protein
VAGAVAAAVLTKQLADRYRDSETHRRDAITAYVIFVPVGVVVRGVSGAVVRGGVGLVRSR